jgi:autotransporter-associated beta strand protein
LSLGDKSATIGAFRISGGTVSGSGTLTSNSGFEIQGGVVGIVLAGSAGLTKSGDATVVLDVPCSYGGRTTVTGGRLELTPVAQDTVFNLGGADIQSGRMVFDYCGDSLGTMILGLLTLSYHGGQWDMGQFRNSTAASTGLTLGWLDSPERDAVTVMATYAGDFNLDGVVNGADKDILTSHLGRTGDWSAGDANYDGRIDLVDWYLWKSSLGLPQLGGGELSGATTVPEAGTLALAVVGMMGWMANLARTKSRMSMHPL